MEGLWVITAVTSWVVVVQSVSQRSPILPSKAHSCYNWVSLDGMVYTRGTREDYDRWARVTGDPGWSWDAMFPYFKKVQCFHLSTKAGRELHGQYTARAMDFAS